MSPAGSIYDGDEGEEERPWFLPTTEDTTPLRPAVIGGRAPDADLDLSTIRDATAGLGAELYELGRLTGRFEAALRAGAPRGRLRAMEVSDLMWRTGHTVRAERIALFEADGGVARDEDRESYRLAAWALRRLRAPLDLTSPAGLLGWIDRQAAREEAALPVPLADLMGQPAPAETEAALGNWLAARDALGDLPRPVAAAALSALWLRDPRLGGERAMTGRLLAARLAAEPARGDEPAAFLPVSIGATRGSAGREGADLGAAVVSGIADQHRALQRALGELERLAIWQRRAAAWAGAQKGRVATALLGSLTENLALSAGMAAELAGCTAVSAAAKLERFVEAGLAREITGQASWRFWTARL